MLDAANDLKSKLSDPSLLTDKAYVAGEWVAADDGGTFEVRNPATGEQFKKDADKVVKMTIAKALKDSVNE